MKIERVVKKFFDGLDEGIIYARKCPECGAIEFPPHYACNTCGYHKTEWTTLSGKGIMKAFVLSGPMNARAELADMEAHCFGEVELEEGCSINAIIFGVSKKNADEIEAKLPVPIHARITQMDGYKTLYFEVDKEDAE